MSWTSPRPGTLRDLVERPGHWTADEAIRLLRNGLREPAESEREEHVRVMAWLCRGLPVIDRSRVRADALYEAFAQGRGSGEPGFLTGTAAALRVGYQPWLGDVDPVIVSRFLGLGCPWATGPAAPGERVLDLGCGGGLDTVIAARMVGWSGQAIGVDLRSVLFPSIDRRPSGSSFRVAPAHRTGMSNDWASTVIANGLPPLVSGAGHGDVLHEIRRVLRQGGVLKLITLVVQIGDHDAMSDDTLILARRTGKPLISDVIAFLERGGFRCLDTVLQPAPLRDHPLQGYLRSVLVLAERFDGPP